MPYENSTPLDETKYTRVEIVPSAYYGGTFDLIAHCPDGYKPVLARQHWTTNGNSLRFHAHNAAVRAGLAGFYQGGKLVKVSTEPKARE